MLRTIGLFPVFLSAAVSVAICIRPSLAEDAELVHSTLFISTQASSNDSYFTGDTDSFNAMIAKLAKEFPPPPAVIGQPPIKNIVVSIYQGDGLSYLQTTKNRAESATPQIVMFAPSVPAEVLSGKKAAFNFDWLTQQSGTQEDCGVSIALFTGGAVDLFKCKMPQSVELRIGRYLENTASE